MVCIVFHVHVVSEVPWHWADPLSGQAIHVLVWSKKYVFDPELILSPDRSWLCKARVVWVT